MMATPHNLTDEEINFLLGFFTDSWTFRSQAEGIMLELDSGRSIEEVTKECKDDPGFKLACRITSTDPDTWISLIIGIWKRDKK